MDVFMLVIGIVLAVAGLLCLYLGPRRVITTTVNKVEHEYNTSTDYERLYDLLMEGRTIIILKGTSLYPTLANVWDGSTISGRPVKKFYGFGVDNPLDGCTKEKFILFCKFYEVKYLDQIDKYLTLQDYMKK
jgi:hypothetical protein